MRIFRDLFLLDPDVVFLNHGSFGATPRPVFEEYQAWQRRLERQPVKFLAKELPVLLESARTELGVYLNAPPSDLVFIPNATFGVNVIARSLRLKPGDEVLSSDHEYGACDRTWEFLCARRGARYVRQHVSMPVRSPDHILEELWQGVTPRTRLVFTSHITSPTALTLPVQALCQRARDAEILSFIDGAHAPGHIPVDLAAIGADFYTGNCHKWMMAPKGSAFLFAHPDVQDMVEPLVVSWGWKPEQSFSTGSPFIDVLQWLGTHDPSAALAVPAAIRFMKEHGWPDVSQGCHAMLESAMARCVELTGLEPLYPSGAGYFHQMGSVSLPPIPDLPAFKEKLFEKYRIEVPCFDWNGRPLLRISMQAYNTPDDVDCLLDALGEMLEL